MYKSLVRELLWGLGVRTEQQWTAVENCSCNFKLLLVFTDNQDHHPNHTEPLSILNLSTSCLIVTSIGLQISRWIEIFLILNREIILEIWKSYSHNISRELSSSFLSQSPNVWKVKVGFEMSSLSVFVACSSRATSQQKLRISVGLYKDNSCIWNMVENNPAPQWKTPGERHIHTQEQDGDPRKPWCSSLQLSSA